MQQVYYQAAYSRRRNATSLFLNYKSKVQQVVEQTLTNCWFVLFF